MGRAEKMEGQACWVGEEAGTLLSERPRNAKFSFLLRWVQGWRGKVLNRVCSQKKMRVPSLGKEKEVKLKNKYRQACLSHDILFFSFLKNYIS